MRYLVVFALFFAVPLASASSSQVAITFDDLPEHGELPPGVTRLHVARSILATLKVEHMPPVYGFINAVALEDTPREINVLKAWRFARQPLGSHTYSHADLSSVTAAKYEEDIARNEPLLGKLMQGEDWRWFRYPYLREGETLEKRDAVRGYLKEKGYRTAQVSLNFEDWAWNDPYARCSAKHNTKELAWLHDSYLAAADESITQFRDLTHRLYGRDISYVLLLHIGPFDAKMLPELIALLRRRGFTFVSLPEAMSDAVYGEDPNIAVSHGLTFQEQVAIARKISFSPDTRSLKRLDTVCH